MIDNLVAESVKRRKSGQIVNPILENNEKYKDVLKEFERVYDHMLGF